MPHLASRFLRVALLSILALAGASATAPRPAWADSPGRVLVIALEHAGVAEPLYRRTLGAAEKQLRLYPKFEIVPLQVESIIDEMFDLECLDIDDECMGRIARKYQVGTLLLLEMEASAGGFVIALRQFDAATQAVTASFRRVDVPEGEARAMATEGVTSLYGDAPAPRPKTGVVRIETSVPGARVRIGAVAAGPAPLIAEVAPGTYPVEVIAEGYENFVGRVTVAADQTATVQATLVERPKTPPSAMMPPVAPPGDTPASDSEGTPVYKQWWFWTGIGALVVASAVTTAVLLLQEPGGPDTGSVDFLLVPTALDRDPAILRR